MSASAAIPARLFTPEERESLRAALVSAARSDSRLVAAAHAGSGSVGLLDRWSDIDLAFSVSQGAAMDQVIADWTAAMYRDHDAVAHVDVRRGNTVFRVFLLRSSLQVDLAFWPEDEFRAIGATFRLVFGRAQERPSVPPPTAAELIGMAWLYALHVRSSIARRRLWQAEYMLSAMRSTVLALACVRHGLNPRDARGVDDLPEEDTSALQEALVGRLDPVALRGALSCTTAALLRETRRVDASLADQLSPTLSLLLGD